MVMIITTSAKGGVKMFICLIIGLLQEIQRQFGWIMIKT